MCSCGLKPAMVCSEAAPQTAEPHETEASLLPPFSQPRYAGARNLHGSGAKTCFIRPWSFLAPSPGQPTVRCQGSAPYALRRRGEIARSDHSLLTVRRLRPFARRRLRTRRPFFVLMRTRNPCVRLRWRVLGWNVRFPFMLSISLLSGTEPTMLANAFGRCQSDQKMLRCQWRLVCAKVCVLQDLFADPGRNSSPTPAETGCAFGLFPKFSTPVEKTVEIRIDPPLSFGFRLILRGFYKGESEKYCEIGLLAR